MLVCLYRDPAVQHALKVRRAVQQDSYHDFFELYKVVPNMGMCILKPMLDTVRLQALHRIYRSYKPAVPVEFVAKELGFLDVKSAVEFLTMTGCQFCDEGSISCINTTDSIIDASGVHTQDKLLL